MIRFEKKIWFIGLVVIGVFYVSSCVNKTYYKETVDLDNKGLSIEDTLVFGFLIDNVSESYNLILDLEYHKNYPYQNIFFFVDVLDPSGKSYRDTIECIMAMPSGQWLGELSGDYVSQSLIYRYNIHFPIKGQYKLNIQHAMRDSVIHKMKSLAIRLDEFEE